MKFTFGICTDGNNSDRIMKILKSISFQKIPEFEVLVVGARVLWPTIGNFSPFEPHNRLMVLPFDDGEKTKGWITKKKNLITQMASFENIVFLHDYFEFQPGWYYGWTKFGNDFEVANNVILNLEGTRHSDWTVNMFDVWKLYPEWDWKMWDVNLEYNETKLTKIQYISGGYWVAKKQFMLDNPLDESLGWGEKEDIEWSERIRQKTEFKFNFGSTVHIMKPGKWAPGLINREVLENVKKANGL